MFNVTNLSSDLEIVQNPNKYYILFMLHYDVF